MIADGVTIPVPIETRRLLLRPFTPGDIEQIHYIYSDPAVWTHIDGVEASRSLTETRRRVDRFITCQRQHGYSFWAVREKRTGELVGDGGLIPRVWRGPEIELGYRFARSHWGQGFATEVATAWLSAAFEHLELERIVAVARADHLASRRVMERIGMTLEAFEGADVVYAIRRATPHQREAARGPRSPMSDQ
ncbi:MAG: GNAT family N-acetyltransferase [Solirubrobacterales bacterium]|nr:GNAT family N-acetyltransferase [Solirubrobacterales bacterium]